MHFAAFENHIGFYPTPSAIHAFRRDLVAYQSAKGSVQFPLDRRYSPLDANRSLGEALLAHGEPAPAAGDKDLATTISEQIQEYRAHQQPP